MRAFAPSSLSCRNASWSSARQVLAEKFFSPSARNTRLVPRSFAVNSLPITFQLMRPLTTGSCTSNPVRGPTIVLFWTLTSPLKLSWNRNANPAADSIVPVFCLTL